ncbi:MAG: PIG-L deacetylase family protein [Candidatus Palauibacterales bacterium]|nr:PIG-L deacetylase family protein [Candidatus Palauibacterales bacterium]MDP2481675.1 PIG-L deacetylase family protein [Candidatus Palauibacterales bacterium]
MLRISGLSAKGELSILCLGAHSDDLEIGCGGTIRRLLHEHPGSRVTWVVLSAHGERAEEARRSAGEMLAEAGQADVVLKTFRDGYFPWEGAEIKSYLEHLAAGLEPDLIFTHRRSDLHQDHRTVGDLTWNQFRDHFILEYEIPKYDGDLSAPNLFVPLTQEEARAKIDHLMAHFPSQLSRGWFAAETFESVMRLRAIESRAPTGFAEGFHCRKVVF